MASSKHFLHFLVVLVLICLGFCSARKDLVDSIDGRRGLVPTFAKYNREPKSRDALDEGAASQELLRRSYDPNSEGPDSETESRDSLNEPAAYEVRKERLYQSSYEPKPQQASDDMKELVNQWSSEPKEDGEPKSRDASNEPAAYEVQQERFYQSSYKPKPQQASDDMKESDNQRFSEPTQDNEPKSRDESNEPAAYEVQKEQFYQPYYEPKPQQAGDDMKQSVNQRSSEPKKDNEPKSRDASNEPVAYEVQKEKFYQPSYELKSLQASYDMKETANQQSSERKEDSVPMPLLTSSELKEKIEDSSPNVSYMKYDAELN